MRMRGRTEGTRRRRDAVWIASDLLASRSDHQFPLHSPKMILIVRFCATGRVRVAGGAFADGVAGRSGQIRRRGGRSELDLAGCAARISHLLSSNRRYKTCINGLILAGFRRFCVERDRGESGRRPGVGRPPCRPAGGPPAPGSRGRDRDDPGRPESNL